MLDHILKKVADEQELGLEDVTYLLRLENDNDLARLYTLADLIRQKNVGDEVHLRGLIEFSNYCRKNCCYCGLRRDNHRLGRYRMSLEEILAAVAKAVSLDYKTVVLQSGEDMHYTVGKLTDLVKQIKSQFDVAVTLSIGERPRREYEQLYEAGADRFLLRFETSNRELYRKLHPDSVYETRMEILGWLRDIGYQVGSGVMVGLPGQTVEDLAGDILMFKELNLDMVGVGPYICHQETPLAGSQNGELEMTFKVIALTRIVTRDAHIPATTAVATLRPADGREKALQIGANVVMPNVTPAKYRAMYELYPAKVCITEEAEHCQACLQGRIFSLGRPVSTGYGHSFKQAKSNLAH